MTTNPITAPSDAFKFPFIIGKAELWLVCCPFRGLFYGLAYDNGVIVCI